MRVTCGKCGNVSDYVESAGMCDSCNQPLRLPSACRPSCREPASPSELPLGADAAQGLTCPFCGAAELQPHGFASVLDGARGWLCGSCRRSVGPTRSRFLLAFYVLACVGLSALVGRIAAKGIAEPLLAGRPPEIDLASRNGLLVCAGVFVGLAATAASVRALFRRQPFRVRLSELPEVEQGRLRADRYHELVGYAVMGGGVLLLVAVIAIVRAML